MTTSSEKDTDFARLCAPRFRLIVAASDPTPTAAAAPHADGAIIVATDGDDATGDGSLERPFASLARARAWARAWRGASAETPAPEDGRVLARGGGDAAAGGGGVWRASGQANPAKRSRSRDFLM